MITKLIQFKSTIHMFAKTFPRRHLRFWILFAVGGLAASLIMGCSKDWNAEYKPTAVTGKVVRKDGKPLIGEMVISLVTSEGSPQVRSQGLVKADGTITGLTFVGIGGDGRPGMIPGSHYVEFNRVQKIGDDAEPADAARDQAWKEFLKAIPHPLMIEIAEDANEILIEI